MLKNKIVSAFVVAWLTISSAYASWIWSAEFLAKYWIISKKNTEKEYRLDDSITRWEIAKIVTKLMKKTPTPDCRWYFSDLKSSSWQCKYAEFLVDNWVVKNNDNYRPNDPVTKIEVLKMIFKSLDYEKTVSTWDWKKDYVESSKDLWIIKTEFYDFDKTPNREFVFNLAKEFYDFTYLREKEVEKEKEVKMPTKKMSN